jgi:hypothetical protein
MILSRIAALTLLLMGFHLDNAFASTDPSAPETFPPVSLAVSPSSIMARTMPTSCKGDDADPLSPTDPKIPGGRYRGHCYDPKGVRSVRRLTRDERISFGVDPDDSSIEVVGNFYHSERNWVAVIPLERVQGLILQLIQVVPHTAAFHGQLRIKMSPTGRPIKLIEQVRGPDRLLAEMQDDLMYSEFGVRTTELSKDFSLIDGVEGNYLIAYALTSYSDKARDDHTNNLLVRQYDLGVSRMQAENVLVSGISLGTTYDMTQMYKVLTRNCLHVIFEALKAGLGLKRQSWAERLWLTFDPRDVMHNLFDHIGSGIKRLDDSELDIASMTTYTYAPVPAAQLPQDITDPESGFVDWFSP